MTTTAFQSVAPSAGGTKQLGFDELMDSAARHLSSGQYSVVRATLGLMGSLGELNGGQQQQLREFLNKVTESYNRAVRAEVAGVLPQDRPTAPAPSRH